MGKTSGEQVPDKRLDARGLSCPLPLLKARQALNSMECGQWLEVLANDPGSLEDFQVFARQSGDHLQAARQEGDTYRYLLRKS